MEIFFGVKGELSIVVRIGEVNFDGWWIGFLVKMVLFYI